MPIEAYLHAKFRLDPSNVSLQYTQVTDRTDRETDSGLIASIRSPKKLVCSMLMVTCSEKPIENCEKKQEICSMEQSDWQCFRGCATSSSLGVQL